MGDSDQPDAPRLSDTISELEGTMASVSKPPPVDPLSGTMASVGEADAAPRSGSWRAGSADRYEIGELLGKGLQGEVKRAFDRVLERDVAMKILRGAGELAVDDVNRFIAEARLMAQIAHPHVMPVFDAGAVNDGRPFFTMPLLKHRTLAEYLAELATQPTVPMVRLMRHFANACMAVHAAHERGVVHRDLKPQNMILGPTGDLLVTDFGLARLGPSPLTQPGTMVGTPLYMAPEQARGEPIVDARADVYSLGAVLYELLTLRRPIEKSTLPEQLVALLHDMPIPASERVTDRPVPRDLSDLAMECLAKEADGRPPSAAALVDRIEGWLDGRFEEERRHAEAERRIAEARESWRAAQALTRTVARERVELDRQSRAVPPHAPLEEKERLWGLEEDLARVETQRDDAEEAAIVALDAALDAVPEHPTAKEEWVSLQLGRRERYLAMGDERAARRATRQAVRVGGEEVRRRLEQPAVLRIECALPATIERFEPSHGRLTTRSLGSIQTVREVPAGSYRVRIEGQQVSYLPFVAQAGEAVVLEVDIPERVPSGFAWIHTGVAELGGDDGTGDTRTVEVPGFALARAPVACGEYLRWLRSMDDPMDALLRGPRATAEGGPYWKIIDGKVAIPPEDEDGDTWDAAFPVFGISAHDAEAYIAWLSERDGIAYRLPTDREWERAARGADGRHHPWGQRFDPALCKMRSSRPGQPRPEPIGTFTTDVSPFGVVDMAGGIAEWTSSLYLDDERFRCVKGGAWSSRAHRCAAAFRGSMDVAHVSADLGFRLAVSAAD
ncbi:MAG: SUMF1/EgtB/PvdO family nonheme iron enzyme [Deltaproteobacteria bacterium]|nr:SUMF1/EgtB/PvdO family nonheme iron enzyme [Deltaproteobacteria bacterium]